MNMDLTLQETCELYAMLAEDSSDIVMKTDRCGFLTHASGGIDDVFGDAPMTSGGLFGCHLLDIVHPQFAPEVRRRHEAIMRGRSRGDRLEVRAGKSERRGQWFELNLRQLLDPAGLIYGALVHMRSIDERRQLEDRLFEVALTDPLTGFANRQACLSMLDHLIERKVDGTIALFSIDHFKSMNLRFGQKFGDEILVAFAQLLRAMMRTDDILCRLGGEELAILLPGTGRAQAEALCGPVISMLAAEARVVDSSDMPITASCGLATFAGSVDLTLKRVELALFMAKAKGRNRMELGALDGAGIAATRRLG